MSDAVLLAVEAAFRVPRVNIITGGRGTADRNARFAAALILREADLSFAGVGAVLRRDPTTIQNAVCRARELAAKDPAYAATLETARQLAQNPQRAAFEASRVFRPATHERPPAGNVGPREADEPPEVAAMRRQINRATARLGRLLSREAAQ